MENRLPLRCEYETPLCTRWRRRYNNGSDEYFRCSYPRRENLSHLFSEMDSKVQIFDYNGNGVTFRKGDSVMVNATEMAKPFGKRPNDFLSAKSTQELIGSLSAKTEISATALVIVNQGGNNQGTWLHEDLALIFAQWLSPTFYLWCNDRIKELMQVGFTATPATLEAMIANPDLVIGMATQLKQLRAENAEKQRKIEEDAPKVDFHDKIIASDDTCLVRELAKVLTQRGFKIGQNQLYELLCREGYLIKSGSDRNQPTQPYIESGIFEVDRKPWVNPVTKEVHIGRTPKVTAKGLKYFVRKFLGKAAVL